ncbi:aspartyl-phosphate phosphatase Spo0E family protein [Paenibacillus sp. 481]|uniref:aspartyl-phosphate phosphatase Spo0E family protein n=1 Tax=Paenibacillus sp. 481 TaxID=2835869 RepID=UPI001E4893E0|nr:aspartyl-phosphate phosphatase Spo0E family protein [Paenibacillus sp. 481]UHA72150.1 aspartyl-phosphate phosphatase Spo0E family protein [Paenibacillus sp. 481]
MMYSHDDMLLFQLNSLKKQLDRAVDEHHSLTDERVVKISQELDECVLQYQKNVWTKIKYKGVLQ